MNKLFTKVAALTLGVAMAAGVGVALGSAKASEAKAASGAAVTGYTQCTSVADISNHTSSKFLIAGVTSSDTYFLTNGQTAAARIDGVPSASLVAANSEFDIAYDTTSVSGKEGYTIKGKTKYYGYGSSGTNIAVSDSVSSDKFLWTISVVDGRFRVLNVGMATAQTVRCLVFRAGDSNQFAAYSQANIDNTEYFDVDFYYASDTPTPVTQYDVTDSVENGSVSPSKVNEGATLTATITPDTGYVLPESVSVTMGGTPVTASYSEGVVTVQNVTGNVVISGTCPAKPAPQPVVLPDGEYTASLTYVNPLPESIVVKQDTTSTQGFLTTSSSGLQYDDSHSEYKLAAKDDYIEFTNFTNAVIKRVDVEVYKYDNFNIYADDSTTAAHTGDTLNHNDHAIISTTLEATNKVKIACNGGDNGTRNQAFYSISFAMKVGGDPVPVTGVELNAEEAQIPLGGSYPLTATVSPDGADDKTVSWSSSNDSVATVSNSGVVSAQGKGDATITVTTTDGGFTDTFTAHVVELNYGTESAPLTVEEAKAVLEVTGASTSVEKLWVYGEVYSSSYSGTTYNDYTIWLKSSDGQTDKAFEIYGGTIPTAITEDDTVANALQGIKVICNGYGKIHNSTTYELCKANNEKPTIAKYSEPVPAAWTTEQENTFKTNLDGFVPKFFGPIDGDLVVESFKVSFVLDGDKVSTVNEEFVAKGWESIGGGIYRDETEAGHGVVDGYAICNNDPSTQTEKTTVSFEYREYFEVTITEGNESNKVPVARGDNFELPQPTQSLIPSGQQFKGWRVDNEEELRQAGDTLQEVEANATVVAVYEDIPVIADWTPEQLSGFEHELDGVEVPFINADFVAAVVVYENSNYAYGEVEGDQTGDVNTAFASWTPVEESATDYAHFEKETTNGVVKAYVNYDSSKNSTSLMLQFVETTVGWDDTMLGYFAAYLRGIVPTYADSVSGLAYVASYNDFELDFTDLETASAQLATLCANWQTDGTGANVEYWTWSQDEVGYALGYLYEEGGSYSVTLQFVQVYYPAAQEQAFAAKLNGNIPPFLSSVFEEFTYVDAAGMFCSNNAMNSAGLSNMQSKLTKAGFASMGSATTATRYVCAVSTSLSGTLYQYGAYCQDGGIMVIELFVLTQYGAMTMNVAYVAQPVSIALSGEYKTTFEYGEEFSAEGMVVTATMSDQSEQDVTSSAQFSGFDSLVEGEQTVTVTVGAVSTTYTVTVSEKVLESIAITSEPTKVEYEIGEEFDSEGLEVTATYNAGDPVVLDLADVEISGFDSTTAGEKTITVSFGGKSAEFTVTVAEAPYDANAFAKELLEEVAPICANYDGKKNNKTALKGVWTEMASKYETLSEEEKAKVVEAVAKTDGTDLEKAMAFYNYACKKYGLTKFIAGRQVKAIVNEPVSTGNSILPIIVIVAASVTAVTAIGVVIALKRRKNFLTK